MRKPAFRICENKDADQLRGNGEADQCLCFATRIVPFLYFINPKFQASSHLLCDCTAQFVSDLVGNPEDQFSHNEAQIMYSFCRRQVYYRIEYIDTKDTKGGWRGSRLHGCYPDSHKNLFI